MSTSRYKLLITDLDGTLIDGGGKIHERDRRAIETLLARGVRVSVCTGRMYSGTRQIARVLGLNTAVGCVDGSHIVHSSDDRELVLRSITSEGARILFDTLASVRPVSFVFADDTVLHDGAGVEFLPYISTWSERAIEVGDAIGESRTRYEASTCGVVALGSKQQIQSVAGELRQKAPDTLQSATFPIRRPPFSALWGMVVRAAGASKGTALEWIARHEGVDPAQTIAVGDWLNDIPMLCAAGRSFAMAHAPDEVKRVASDVLDADVVKGGGIEEAAQRAELL
jgi:hydroxymethylpyrimidine pyrophosphatase-like HAD family hydrolase